MSQLSRRLRKRPKRSYKKNPVRRSQPTERQAELLHETLFRTEAEDAFYSIGCAVGSGVEVANLKLAQQTDAHHLDSGKDQDACDKKDRAVKLHDVLAGENLKDKQPGSQAGAGQHAERSNGSEEVERAGHVAEEEADGKKIEEDTEGAGDAVVALAKLAGWIRDGNLADAGAVPGGQRRNEAVHLSVEGNVLDDLATVGLEGRAEVVDVHSAEIGHEPVGGAGGDAAEEEVISTLTAPATDDVITFFKLGKKIGNLVGRMLEIAVHRKNELSLGVVKSGSEGGGLAEVAAKFDDENAGIDSCNLFKQPISAIA